MAQHIKKPLVNAAITGSQQIFFGPFRVTNHVFHLTPHTFALVNLKPLLPGHVLVSPIRVVPRLLDMTDVELTDFWSTVRRVTAMIKRVYAADALNVSIQDGPAAGQSVPHVHCHIIPRHASDLDNRGGNDALYEMLNRDEGDIGKHWIEFTKARLAGAENFLGVDNDKREPRTMDEMEREAHRLHLEMEKSGGEGEAKEPQA